MPTPQLNAAELADFLRRALVVGQQPLILGPPGCGKSAIVEQVTEEVRHDLVTIYPALADPTDIKGYLTLDAAGEPHFRAAGELAEVMKATTPTVLFIDELAQASDAVQKACMSLVWARRVGERRLPDCVRIVGASNRVTDTGCGAGRLNPALLTRFHTTVELVPDAPTWIAWARTAGIDLLLVEYVDRNRALLTAPMPTGPANVYERWTCARTLALASQIIKGGYPESLLPRLLEGCIGQSAAAGYCALRDILRACPTIAEITVHPSTTRIPHDLSTLRILAATCANCTTPETIEAIAEYVERMPAEAQPHYWSTLGQYHPELKSHQVYIDWAVAQAAL